MKNINELLDVTRYGQYDVQSQESKDKLKEEWYIIIYESNDNNTVWLEYIGEWFDWMDDSMIGSTAYARCARPVIVDIYKKSENYEKECKKYEEAKKQEEEDENNYEENLKNGSEKINCSINKMARGYTIIIKTTKFEEFELKQKNVKELEKETNKTEEALCELIEKNYEKINKYFNFIKISGKQFSLNKLVF